MAGLVGCHISLSYEPMIASLRSIAQRSVPAFMCLAAVASATAAEIDERSPELFKEWKGANEQRVAPYERFLEQRQALGTVPMHQLLRTSFDWRKEACRKVSAPPFDVPPDESWDRMAATLRLVSELRATGSLPDYEVVSAYRTPTVNKCSSSKSDRHIKNAALDLVFSDASAMEAATLRLCTFFWRDGEPRSMGLGFYGKSHKWPYGRIHIDTLRYQTWGPDTKRDTSPCLRVARVHRAR